MRSWANVERFPYGKYNGTRNDHKRRYKLECIIGRAKTNQERGTMLSFQINEPRNGLNSVISQQFLIDPIEKYSHTRIKKKEKKKGFKLSIVFHTYFYIFLSADVMTFTPPFFFFFK